LKFELGINVTL